MGDKHTWRREGPTGVGAGGRARRWEEAEEH